MKKLSYLFPALALVSCTAHHMATADKAYERMAYAKAACSYEKALRRTEDRDAALRMAEAYQRQNKFDKAADWYAYAERVAPLTREQGLSYARALMSMDRPEQALDKFNKVLAISPGYQLALEGAAAARERHDFYKDSTLYTVRLLQLPGLAGAFSTAPHRNGLVFAGETSSPSGKVNPWNGLSFLDLYSISRTPSGSWTTPVKLEGEVNGRFHEGPAVFSADGRTMYFTRSDYYKFRLNKDGSSVSHLKLFRATLGPDGKWGDIHQFAHNGEEFSTGHAALSKDGSTLYFISDRPGGMGGTDIYRCSRTGDTWGDPENLGASVNTAGNEMFPTLRGDTLYFSSNGHRGLGGLDIQRTWPIDGGWAPVQNMNHPLNTPFDDFALVFDQDGRSGFLSSDRSGRDMIHTFTMNDPILVLSGICSNELTGEPMAGVEVKLTDMSTRETKVLVTGADGRFQFDLKPGTDLHVQGSKDGMFTQSIDLSTKGQRVSKVYEAELELAPVVIDKPIIVKNIYYDFDKWDIRPDAAVELKKLARLFIDNPELHFELSSHTDSRASENYNLVLSDARARSAVDFLIRNGVDPKRITAMGYGETRLINHCKDGVPCSEEQHQENRRTEFKVVKSDTVMN